VLRPTLYTSMNRTPEDEDRISRRVAYVLTNSGSSCRLCRRARSVIAL